MTREEIIEVMIIERNCVERQDTPLCDRHCEKCDLCLPTDRVVKAYEQVIDILHEQPCDDVISREAVLKVIDGWYEQNRDTENIEDLIILITYMGSVQPSECEECGKKANAIAKYNYDYGKQDAIRKGHWIIQNNKSSNNFFHYNCDRCGWEVDSPYNLSYFCPNCGADMREGDNE